MGKTSATLNLFSSNLQVEKFSKIENWETNTAQNNSYGQNWCKTTNFFVE